MKSILGDVREAEFLDFSPVGYRFSGRLADLENVRGSIADYLDTVEKGEDQPRQKTGFKSILEDPVWEQKQQSPELSPSHSTPEDSPQRSLSPSDLPEVPVKPDLVKNKASPPAKSKEKKVKFKLDRPKPSAPRRNFVQENIINIQTKRRSPLGPETQELVEKVLKPVSKRPLILKGVVPPVSTPQNPVKPKIEDPDALLKRVEGSKVVRNKDILTALFDKVADSLALHWEEAAEMIIDDLLFEEVERLSSLERTSEPLRLELNVTDMLAMVQDYSTATAVLSQKYGL